MARGFVVSAQLAGLLVISCGDEVPERPRGVPSGPAACTPGELTLPDGRCQPAGLPPDMPCAPGQLALPDGSCQPAGVPEAACAAGTFLSDGRGGCEAILPDAVCPRGLMAVPGERACREVAPCGAGTWGDIPVEANTQYVDQSYTGGNSDGSWQRPWITVTAGIDAADDGAIVAVAAGRYQENLVIAGTSVRLWGRCPAQTELSPVGEPPATLIVGGAGASGTEVRSLALTGPSTGVGVSAAPSVVLDALWIHDADYGGMLLADTTGVTVRGSLIERTYDFGIAVLGAQMTVLATVVRATQPDGAGAPGMGIIVTPDETGRVAGELALRGSLLEQNHDSGIMLFASEATIESTVVRATQANGGVRGQGISVLPYDETRQGSKLSLKASLVEQNHATGVLVSGSEAAIESTVVRATQPSDESDSGQGIGVLWSPSTKARSKLSLKASLVQENHAGGVVIYGADAAIEATIVRSTQVNSSGKFGDGIIVFPAPTTEDPNTDEPSTLALTASLLEQNHTTGLFAGSSDVTVEATAIRASQPDGSGAFGRGIQMQATSPEVEKGKLSLTASLIEQCYEVSVVTAGSDVLITASVVRATQPATYGALGDGVLAHEYLGPGKLVLAATELTENARVGVLYLGAAGDLSGVRSSGNQFGLVLQPGATSARPTLGEGNAFEGNKKQDTLEGGDFQVPDAALPLP